MDQVKEYLTNFNAEIDDLDKLQDTLDSIWDSGKQDSIVAELFSVFENNPDHDGYGVFWSILHGLEGIDEYELQLCESIEIKPSEFNVLMAMRVLNPKSVSDYKVQVKDTLVKALSRSDLSETIKEEIQNCLEI